MIWNKISSAILFKSRDGYPDTFQEELHFQCNKIILPAGLIYLFAWLPYISVDSQLVPNQPWILYLRYGLSLAGFLAIILHFSIFKNRAMYTLVFLGFYIEIAVGIITGLSGTSPNYIGGYLFCLMLLLMTPIPIFASLGLLVLSILSFIFSFLSTGVDIKTLPLEYQYSLQDLTITVLVLSVFLQILNKTRFRSWQKSKKIENQREEIKKDKEKIDCLLLNILPKTIALELKENGHVKPVHYNLATIVFTDFVDFTKIAEKLKPDELVQELDDFFSEFDKIIGEFRLEKLKTIGDSYMYAGGIPIENSNNPIDCCLAALRIRQYINLKNQKSSKELQWKIRIGINSGSIMAGVVGRKKFIYDIWGDTVNIASRMESSGSPDEINISEITFSMIHNFFDTEFRGKVYAKNKGDLNMYFLKQLKPEFSQDISGILPNSRFWENYKKCVRRAP